MRTMFCGVFEVCFTYSVWKITWTLETYVHMKKDIGGSFSIHFLTFVTRNKKINLHFGTSNKALAVSF